MFPFSSSSSSNYSQKPQYTTLGSPMAARKGIEASTMGSITKRTHQLVSEPAVLPRSSIASRSSFSSHRLHYPTVEEEERLPSDFEERRLHHQAIDEVRGHQTRSTAVVSSRDLQQNSELSFQQQDSTRSGFSDRFSSMELYQRQWHTRSDGLFHQKSSLNTQHVEDTRSGDSYSMLARPNPSPLPPRENAIRSRSEFENNSYGFDHHQYFIKNLDPNHHHQNRDQIFFSAAPPILQGSNASPIKGEGWRDSSQVRYHHRTFDEAMGQQQIDSISYSAAQLFRGRVYATPMEEEHRSTSADIKDRQQYSDQIRGDRCKGKCISSVSLDQCRDQSHHLQRQDHHKSFRSEGQFQAARKFCTQERRGINSSTFDRAKIETRSTQYRSETNSVYIHEKYHIRQVTVNEEIDVLIWKLHHLKDQGSYDEYFVQFVKLVFPIERLLTPGNQQFVQEDLLDLFVNGLQEDTKRHVQQSAPSTLLYAMNLATYFEDEVKQGVAEGDDPITELAVEPFKENFSPFDNKIEVNQMEKMKTEAYEGEIPLSKPITMLQIQGQENLVLKEHGFELKMGNQLSRIASLLGEGKGCIATFSVSKSMEEMGMRSATTQKIALLINLSSIQASHDTVNQWGISIKHLKLGQQDNGNHEINDSGRVSEGLRMDELHARPPQRPPPKPPPNPSPQFLPHTSPPPHPLSFVYLDSLQIKFKFSPKPLYQIAITNSNPNPSRQHLLYVVFLQFSKINSPLLQKISLYIFSNTKSQIYPQEPPKSIEMILRPAAFVLSAKFQGNSARISHRHFSKQVTCPYAATIRKATAPPIEGCSSSVPWPPLLRGEGAREEGQLSMAAALMESSNSFIFNQRSCKKSMSLNKSHFKNFMEQMPTFATKPTHQEIKRDVLLMQLRGVHKSTPGGINIRGDGNSIRLTAKVAKEAEIGEDRVVIHESKEHRTISIPTNRWRSQTPSQATATRHTISNMGMSKRIYFPVNKGRIFRKNFIFPTMVAEGGQEVEDDAGEVVRHSSSRSRDEIDSKGVRFDGRTVQFCPNSFCFSRKRERERERQKK